MRLTTCELSEFSGRTHKLGLYVWVSGHSFDSITEKFRHLLVLYDHGINIYIIDHFLSVCGFLYQVLYIRFSMFIRTSGLDYSESYHIVIHVTQYTFSYISIIHYLGLSIYCTYVSHAT